MKKFGSFALRVTKRTKWLGLMALSVVAPSTAAAIAPIAPDTNVWRDVRGEMAEVEKVDVFSPALTQVLERVESSSDIKGLIRLSYAVAMPDEVQSLDAFWVRFSAGQRNSARAADAMQFRAETTNLLAFDKETYLRDWLYMARGGNYDCGGNCGNGKGNGGGNGTGSEGGT